MIKLNIFYLIFIFSAMCTAHEYSEENYNTQDEATHTEDYEIRIQEEPPYEYEYEEYYDYCCSEVFTEFSDEI